MTTTEVTTRALEASVRRLPYWWVLREAWFGEAIWAIYLLEERGLTLGQVLVFEAVFSAVGLATDVPTGMLADRYGRRPSMLVGAAIMSLAMAVFGLASELWILLFSYALWGVADALMSGADEAFLYDSLRGLGRAEQFPRRLGRLHAYTAGVTAVCTVAGAAIAHYTSLATPMLLSAGFAAAAVLAGLWLVEPPAERSTSYLGSGASAARRALGTPQLRWAVLLGTAVTLGVSIVYLTFQPILVDAGIPVGWLAAFAVSFHVLVAAGGGLASRVAAGIGLRRTLLLTAVLGTLPLLGGASGTAWLFPVFALPVLAWSLIRPLVADYLSQRVPEQERATVLSVNYMAWRVGTIAALPFVAPLVDRAGTGAALTASAALLGLMALACLLLWLRTGDTTLRAPGERPRPVVPGGTPSYDGPEAG